MEWLPQETILFDRCALDRLLTVELAAGASFLGIEWLVFGRAAMGETVERAWLRDVIRIRRAGRLVLHDAVRCKARSPRCWPAVATAGGARAVATMVYVAPDAERHLDALRRRLAGGGRRQRLERHPPRAHSRARRGRAPVGGAARLAHPPPFASTAPRLAVLRESVA